MPPQQDQKGTKAESHEMNSLAKETEPQQTTGLLDDAEIHTNGSGNQRPLTEFHLFSFLPTEIRLQIWEEAARYKRRVVIHAPYRGARGWARWLWWTRVCKVDRQPDSLSTTQARLHLGWTSSTPNPGMLSANYEARTVALRSWEPAFGFAHLPGRVWINFDRDDVVLVPWEVPRPDFLGGTTPAFWDYLPVLRDYRDHAGRQVKPLSVLAEVWQDTPDLARVQRVVLVNCKDFVDRRVRFRRNNKMFRALESVVSVLVERPPKKKWWDVRDRLRGFLRRQGPSEAIIAQRDHGYVMTQRDRPEQTDIAFARAKVHSEEDEWEERYGVLGPEVEATARELDLGAFIWVGYPLHCDQLDRWWFRTPFYSYSTVNGKAL